MTGGRSPHDPVFFLHHCFIDMLWAQWQSAIPGHRSSPASPRPAPTTPRPVLATPWTRG